jgi:hypothetical protein
MILPLYVFLCLVALVLIIIGLTRPTESAQALIGFAFLFLLSIIMLNGNVEVSMGATTNTSYSYDSLSRVNFTTQAIAYDYQDFSDSNSRQMGYYGVITSVVGFIGVLIAIRRTKSYE